MKPTKVWNIVFALSILLAVLGPARMGQRTVLAASTPVFINEIHYDNAGADTGEAMEIAGPAGTDLTGWSIVLYNGNGAGFYSTESLTGTLPNQQNGFGTLVKSYSADGVQNGSPDGLALVDATNTVVQFLCYEGTMLAVNGPAAGQTCTDIGVSEPTTSPVGYSLQLIGSGTVYEDFTWTSPSQNSFGSVNDGQSFGDSSPIVSSTSPIANATSVELDANITVTFSEPVTVTEPWFTISCDSVTQSATFSGGPTSYTVDPTSNLPAGKTCTVTIAAANVTDQDTPVDAMTEDYSWSFSTVSSNPTPYVSVSIPAQNATGVAVDADLILTFSEVVTLGTPTLECNSSDVSLNTPTTTDNTTYTITSSNPLPYGASCELTVPADQATDAENQPMDADFVLNFAVTNCGGPSTAIGVIQGSGLTSPLSGSVTVEGVVTADLQAASQLRGFFMQSLPSAVDSFPNTSEGLFVFTGSTPAFDVSEGQYVRFTGSVSDYTSTSYGEQARLTELSVSAATANFELCAASGPTITPVQITLPGDSDPDLYLERFENMLVEITGPLTVQQNYFQGRFGQLTLGAGGRIFGRTNGTGGSAADLQRMVILDDGSRFQNVDPYPYYASNGALRAGDQVSSITGVLDQGRINSTNSASDDSFPNVFYRLHPTEPPVFQIVNDRPATPPAVGGTIRVASFNVLNYFVTLNASSHVFPEGSPYYYNSSSDNLLPRGANTLDEFNRQQVKLVEALAEINADVFGLMEIESWDEANAVTALAEALNTKLNYPGLYAAVADPATGTGDDVIQVALIYKTTTLTLSGDSLSSTDTIFDRAPVAQVFESKANNEKFAVVVNHFKSKGCDGATGEDADQADGQGCWNAKRVDQAEALLTFINTSLVPVDPDVLVIGDLNAYGAEDPVNTLTTGNLINQVAAHVPAESRYSYVFDGAAGYLDHALSTARMDSQITGVAFWHINADEPMVIDYNTEFKDYGGVTSYGPDLYAADAYRASDHDPVLVGLQLTPNQAPQFHQDQFPSSQTATEDFLFEVVVPVGAFTDPDAGDTLTYSAALADDTSLPTWLTFDPATRTFSGTPGNSDVGTISIKVTATDTSNASASGTFSLTVENTNDAPTLANAIADQEATEDSPFSYTFAADTFNDVDTGDTLTYSAILAGGDPLPAWLTFNPVTRTFSGTPENDDVGNYTIEVTAADGSSETATDTFVLTVTNTNDAPVVANTIPNQTANEGVVFSFTFAANTFTDVDTGDTLTYSATLDGGAPLPAWLSFNPATRTFSGTPGAQDDGLLTIKVTAADLSDATVSTTFQLDVQAKTLSVIYLPVVVR